MNDLLEWNSVIGQGKTVQILRNMLFTGRMPHALLFVGPDGVGKMKTALITAAALLCHAKENQPCGQCASCLKIRQGVHPDFSIVQPVEASSIKIEQIRAVQQAAVMAPYLGQYKVCIIEAAETMTTQAANSLLKVLEEPAVNVVFMLIASRRHLLLDTIISRCRVMRFKPIDWGTLTEILVKQGISPERAEVAARLAGGRIGMAHELLTSDGLAIRDKAANILFALVENNMSRVWNIAAELDKNNRQEVLLLLKYFIFLMRDIIMLLVGREEEVLFNLDLVKELNEQCRYWQEKQVLAALDEIMLARRALEANANIRLTMEAMLIKLIDLMKGG
ncbi:MAG: DNA polymerase III subunit delta' [Pelosinus sp.]|nr:DNA polymerase III subunit delta' [Pelosinus sp.]